MLKVLVDINPDKSNPQEAQSQLAKIQNLAELTSIKVQLYLCDYHTSLASSLMLHPDGLQKAIAHFKQTHTLYLNQLAEQFAHKNIEYSVRVDWHKPLYQGILKAADEFSADMIMKATHSHNLLQQILFTPNDWQLIKSSTEPVLMTKNNPWQNCRCVVAAVDPSHQSSQPSGLDDQVVNLAKQISERLNLPLVLCHVFDPTGWDAVLNSTATAGIMGQFIVLDDPENHEQTLQQIRQRHQSELTKLQQRHEITDQHVSFLEGSPVSELDKFVQEKQAAIVVIGTTYRSGLLGSTAESLLESISCDLLAVKAKGFTSLAAH